MHPANRSSHPAELSYIVPKASTNISSDTTSSLTCQASVYLGDALVVVASADPAVKAGDRVVSINGVDFNAGAMKAMSLVSGSPPWRRWQLAGALNAGPLGTTVSMGLERDGHTSAITLAYEKQACKLLPPKGMHASVTIATVLAGQPDHRLCQRGFVAARLRNIENRRSGDVQGPANPSLGMTQVRAHMSHRLATTRRA